MGEDTQNIEHQILDLEAELQNLKHRTQALGVPNDDGETKAPWRRELPQSRQTAGETRKDRKSQPPRKRPQRPHVKRPSSPQILIYEDPPKENRMRSPSRPTTSPKRAPFNTTTPKTSNQGTYWRPDILQQDEIKRITDYYETLLRGRDDQIERLEADCLRLEKEAESLRAQVRAGGEEREEYLASLEQVKRSLASREQALQRDAESSKKETMILRNRNEILEEALDIEKGNLRETKEECAQTKLIVQELEQQLDLANAELQQHQSKLTQQSHHHQHDLDSLRSEVLLLNQTLKDMQTQNEHLAKQLTYTQERKAMETQEAYTLEMNQMARELHLTQQQLETTTANNRSLQHKLAFNAYPPAQDSSKEAVGKHNAFNTHTLEQQLLELQLEKQKLESEYLKLPERGRSMAARSRKKEIEGRLEELEKGIGGAKGQLRTMNLLLK